MVLSNYKFFQYCDSNIGLFSNTPCKAIALKFLLHFWYQLFAFFLNSLKLLLFLSFRGDSEKIIALHKKSNEPIYKTDIKIKTKSG